MENSLESQKEGSAQIAVEIQHKDPFLADKGAIEHVLAVEDDIVPFDRADVLYQGGVDAFLCEISRKHRRRDLLSLPVDNASQNQRQATTGVYLLVDLTSAVISMAATPLNTSAHEWQAVKALPRRRKSESLGWPFSP